MEQLEKQYDCLYIAIGAHHGQKDRHSGRGQPATSYPPWRCCDAIGDDVMPDFTGKQRGGHRRRQRGYGRDPQLYPSGSQQGQLCLPPPPGGYDRAARRGGRARSPRARRFASFGRAGAHRGERGRRGQRPSGSSRRSSALRTNPAVPARRRQACPMRYVSRRTSSSWPSARASRSQGFEQTGIPITRGGTSHG